MAQASWPFDNGPGANVSEGQWQKMAALWAPDGIVPGSGGGPGAGEIEVYADGSGFVTKVRPGQAWVKGQFYESDAIVALTHPAPNASNDRIDRVTLRIDWAANLSYLWVEPGNPAALPLPPALQNTPGNLFDFPLAQVAVARGALTIIQANVTSERVFTVLDGGVPVGSSLDWWTPVAPPGWLLMAGQMISKITYARLFAVIGTTFGGTPTSATFGLPDTRGRVTVATDTMGGSPANQLPGANNVGTVGGVYAVALTTANLAQHTHTVHLETFSEIENTGHVHDIDPPATNSDVASADHVHRSAATSGSTGYQSVDHRHPLGDVAFGTTQLTYNHNHNAGSLGGRTGAGSPHSHSGGNPTAGAAGDAGLGGLNQPVTDTATEALHTHPFSVTTGATGDSELTHSHGINAPALLTAIQNNTHNHTLDLPNLVSGGMLDGGSFAPSNHTHITNILPFNSAASDRTHFHTVKADGTTATTPATPSIAHANDQPWICCSKIIKT